VIDGGASYWTPPAVTITGGQGAGGTKASLRCVVEGGGISAINVIDPGYNYSGPVSLTFDPNAAATNTFAATCTLATSVTPGSYGISSSSPTSVDGSLQADGTHARSQTSGSIMYYVANAAENTTPTTFVTASLNNGTWTAADIPIYKANAATAARVTLQFSNSPLTTTTNNYGLNASSSQANGSGYNTNVMSFCSPGSSSVYPKVWVGSTGYPLLLDTTTNFFYSDITVPGGSGKLRLRFGINTESFTTSTTPHPQISSYVCPTQITSVERLTQGTGYTNANATVAITYFQPNTTNNYTSGGNAQFTTLEWSTAVVSTNSSTLNMPGAYTGFVVTNPGSGWESGNTGYVQLAERTKASDAVASTNYTYGQKITFTVAQITASSTQNTGAVASVNVTNGGSNFAVPPQILYTGDGYGLELQSSVVNGSVPTGTSGVTVVDGGAGFTSPPSLSVRCGGATAVAVMRPTMVGAYQCAFRWRDDSVPVSQGGPIYSNFSPIYEYDAGPNASYNSTSKTNWAINEPVAAPSRATHVEFWRSSSDQSLMFYKVGEAALPSPWNNASVTWADILNDEQVFDPDRSGYAAMPVVLPNGGLNAYRFGVPRSDMSACVAWQDRLWYGVSTSTEKKNSIFYSEYDEFESCPDTNELAIQQNVKNPDVMSAMVPFGGQLMVFQKFHCYSLTYLNDPAEDGNLQLVAYRGCWNQQCWDIFEGKIYAADDRGVYSMTASGDIESLSDAIADVFQTRLVRTASGILETFTHLKIDPVFRILRLFCTVSPQAPGSGAISHGTAICYQMESKTWWTEVYPNRVTCSGNMKNELQRVLPIYGTTDRIMYLDHGDSDFSRQTVVSVSITNTGSGYVSPPDVNITSTGSGAVLQAVLNETGGVKSVIVKCGGTRYTTGDAISVTGGGGAGCTGTVTTVTTTASGVNAVNPTTIPWYFQTGNMEIATDRLSSKDAKETNRQIAVTYKPTLAARKMHLRLYYNNLTWPEPNFALRDRGTGFVHDPAGNSTVLNMQSDRTNIGASASGVSVARFAGRGIDDAVGNHRHVAIELSSDPPTSLAAVEPKSNQPLIYDVDIQGIAADA